MDDSFHLVLAHSLEALPSGLDLAFLQTSFSQEFAKTMVSFVAWKAWYAKAVLAERVFDHHCGIPTSKWHCSNQKMHALDTLANLPVASLGTVFFGGDWNFVTANHDRFCLQTLAHTGNKDATLAKRWRDMQHALHLVELHQDHHTFASSFTFSRMDRIDTNLHPAIHMFHQLFAHVLDKVVGVSDHYPVLFGIRAAEKHSRIQRLPSWLVRHPCFTKNFQEIWEWNAIVFNMSVSRVTHLTGFWTSNHVPAKPGKITRRQLQNMSPRCLEGKIAIIGSFIAFTLRNDDFKAHQMASRLDILKDGAGNPLTIRLCCVQRTIDEYLENTHRQIQTEMQSFARQKGTNSLTLKWRTVNITFGNACNEWCLEIRSI